MAYLDIGEDTKKGELWTSIAIGDESESYRCEFKGAIRDMSVKRLAQVLEMITDKFTERTKTHLMTVEMLLEEMEKNDKQIQA